MAPYPSGKGEVCKTFMHRFESDRRLLVDLLRLNFGFDSLKIAGFSLTVAEIGAGLSRVGFFPSFRTRQSAGLHSPSRVASHRRPDAVLASVHIASPYLGSKCPSNAVIEVSDDLKRLETNKYYMIAHLPNLNHLFQTSRSGLPSEYSELDETISPAALKQIFDWIHSHTSCH